MDLSPAPRPAIAVLVDGENLSKDLAPEVLKAARALGDPQVRRVYGNLNAVAGWEEHGFRLCPTRPGKNAADMLLCVEALVLALRDGQATLMIASSDRDFSYLAEQLRELGKQVIGVGEAKAPQAFRAACTRFLDIKGIAPKSVVVAAAKPAGTSILELVKAAVVAAGPTGLKLDALNPRLHSAGFRISTTSEGTWRKWLSSRPDVFACDSQGPNARVRLRNAPHAP